MKKIYHKVTKMTNQIAVIDPFIKTPAVHCFNSLVGTFNISATYHMPGLLGMSSLEKEREKTQAYIVLGSASHISENLPWHKQLGDFLLEELQSLKPILGCCFGHQLMCHLLGSKVDFHNEQQEKLSGVRKIKILHDFWNYSQGEIFHLGVTHKQLVKELGPELISVGEGIKNDMVIHRTLPFLGTQAHPEASDFFCLQDITALSLDETLLARKDGEKLIRRFLEFYHLL
jgi:GMP synthase-like glutamine amidotransferase